MPSYAAAGSPITSAESPNDAAESSNATAQSSNAIINAVEYLNDSESESFCTYKFKICNGEKNDLIVVWWCVFRSWIAVIDLFLEFGIEPQW